MSIYFLQHSIYMINLFFIFLASYYLFFSVINYILALIYLEFIVLVVHLNLGLASFFIDDIIGQIFSIFILAVIAGEVSIGFSLIISYFKQTQDIKVILFNYNTKIV